MADKIVLMKGGKIIQEGSPDDLYDRPNSRFVAEFIGSPQINLLDGRIEAEEGAVRFRARHLVLDLPQAYAAHAGKAVACGIRPNDVTLDPDGAITGTLQIAEKTGADVQFHLDVEGTEFVAVAPRSAYRHGGERMSFAIDPEKLHVFDEASGERISV